MAQTNKQKQDKRKERLQAAAERDGFETWSQALTAWWRGEARLTPAPTDVATVNNFRNLIIKDECPGIDVSRSPRR